MRKATICFLLMLYSALALGQEPQWKVIQHIVLFSQTEPIAPTTLLTPTEPGEYRVSLYLSGLGTVPDNGRTQGDLELLGNDITGEPLQTLIYIDCANVAEFSSLPATTMSFKPQEPLKYDVRLFGSSRCLYNIIITVEQLTQ
jgi:hypothetical protein